MNKRFAPTIIAIGLTLVSASFSQDELPPGPPPAQPAAEQTADAPGPEKAMYRQQVSYALGRNFARNLRDAEIQCDLQSLVAGINDVLTDAQPKWTDEQLEAIMQRFGQEMQQKQAMRAQRLAVKNEKEAAAFLAQNAKRDGVQTTPSGLQYRVLRQGDGPSPTRSDTVRCNYRGVFLNGNEFDNSARHGGPAEFAVDQVIPGWTEALQKMRIGDKWQLFVPPALAYGIEGRDGIEPNALLVFEIELLEIVQK